MKPMNRAIPVAVAVRFSGFHFLRSKLTFYDLCSVSRPTIHGGFIPSVIEPKIPHSVPGHPRVWITPLDSALSENRTCKSFLMRTYILIGLKVLWNEHLQKYLGGW